MLETKFTNDQLGRSHKSEWIITDLQYGVYTTSDTPAQGFFVAGSHIPGGRFLAHHPDNVSTTSRSGFKAILPDLTGTSLLQSDGSDYSAIIADALDGAGNFNFIGVSPVYRGQHDICTRAQINEANKRNGMFEDLIPDTLIGSQGIPIGYTSPESIDNYWEYGGQVSAIEQDRITVYAETDFNIGDEVFIRVTVSDPAAVVPQLLGGVSNVADGTNTQQPTRFNLRVTKPAKAGSAVELQLN